MAVNHMRFVQLLCLLALCTGFATTAQILPSSSGSCSVSPTGLEGCTWMSGVRSHPGKQTEKGKVTYVKKDEDPRDYKVSFDKIKAELGFETLMTVPDGIAEIMQALDEGRFGDPYDPRYKNIP